MAKPKFVVRFAESGVLGNYGQRWANLDIEIRPCTVASSPERYVATQLYRRYMDSASADRLLAECRERRAAWVCETTGGVLTLRLQASPDLAIGEWYGLQVHAMPAELWACLWLSRLLRSVSPIPEWLASEGAVVATYSDAYGDAWTVAEDAPSVALAMPPTPWQADSRVTA